MGLGVWKENVVLELHSEMGTEGSPQNCSSVSPPPCPLSAREQVRCPPPSASRFVSSNRPLPLWQSKEDQLLGPMENMVVLFAPSF